MESIIVDDITILFESDEKPAANLFANACKKSVPLIYDTWGLNVPPKCQVYVMTSWQQFLLHSAPWYRKVIILITFPLLYLNINKEWSKIAGWALPYQPTIGVKPPTLLNLQNKAIGEKIYVQETDLNRKAQGYLCHELVHACSNHLKLPLWLNEGIAMYTVDKLIGNPTVKDETLQLLNIYPHKHKLLNYRNLMNADVDGIVYNYVRGYWLTRFLEKNCTGFLSTLLRKRQNERELVRLISNKLSIRLEDFWNEIDKKIVKEFVL